MDDLVPMRQIESAPKGPAAASWWKLCSVLVLVIAATIGSRSLPTGTVVAWGAAVLLLMVGLGLMAASTTRMLRENRGNLVRLFGHQQVEPRRPDLLLTGGGPLAGSGTVLVSNQVSVPWLLPFVVLVGGVLLVQLLVVGIHNRRVRKLTTTSDA